MFGVGFEKDLFLGNIYLSILFFIYLFNCIAKNQIKEVSNGKILARFCSLFSCIY